MTLAFHNRALAAHNPCQIDQPSNTNRPWTIDVAHGLDEILQVISLRAISYIHEQDCPYFEEVDGNDFAGATHLLARQGNEPIGCARLRWFADFFKLERIAVAKAHRKTGLGVAIMEAAFELGMRKGYTEVLGHVEPAIVEHWKRKCGLEPRLGRESLYFSDNEYVEVGRKFAPHPMAITINSDPMILLRPEGEWDNIGVLDKSNFRREALSMAVGA
jgi:GNAT superfamily N-acetyltransferase